MDQRAVHILEVKKNDRLYTFHMPLHAPIGEAYDVLFECIGEINKQAEKNLEHVKSKKEESEKKEETKVE